MRRSVALVAVCGLAAAASAADDPGPPAPTHFLARFMDEVNARIDRAIIARPPKLVPPKPVAVKWKLAKLASYDLGAPLVALAGADLDGDGKGELYAVTPREVIALAVRGKKLDELGRVAFGGQRALPAPRDVVGTATIDGNSLVASVSGWTRGLRVTWKGKALTAAAGETGFVLCAGEQPQQLAPGRNYFGELPNARYGGRCTTRLVEGDGHPLRARAELSAAGKLAIAVERCAAVGLGCTAANRFEYTGVGIAFEVADVDRDGTPEVIYAGAGAPGDPDTLKIVSLGTDDKKQAKLKKTFTAGGIAGIAVTDLDGDRTDDVLVAVRLAGATRIDLWRLD